MFLEYSTGATHELGQGQQSPNSFEYIQKYILKESANSNVLFYVLWVVFYDLFSLQLSRFVILLVRSQIYKGTIWVKANKK